LYKTGKSTLLKHCFPDYNYASLEDPDIRAFALQDPRGLLTNFGSRTIIDEAQHAPELFSYLQTKIDSVNETGMYILSGSHEFLLLEKISQSLAGRCAVLHLAPFSIAELKSARLLPVDLNAWLFTGGYPRIYNNAIDPADYFPSYIQTYVERDVRLIRNIIYLLKPHHENFGKRLVKAPKIYFYDTGLVASLLGLDTASQITTHYLRGNLFENMVISEYLKAFLFQGRIPPLSYWRDNAQHEVDLLVETGSGLHAIEIKAGATMRSSFFDGLAYFQGLSKVLPENSYVVYAGDLEIKTQYGSYRSWKNLG
jgi:hypothetical protein